MFNLGQLVELFPNCVFKNDSSSNYGEGDASVFFYYLTTPFNPEMGPNYMNRCAMFLAQCAHESSGFSKLVENLNYSVKGLLIEWPNRFTPEEAEQYARNPEKIANRVYANRMGNGDEASGDGWKYRGMGPIQLTGKTLHTDFALTCDQPILSALGAAKSAVWYWNSINGSQLADHNDFKGITRRINGSDDPKKNGLANRLAWLEKIHQIL